MEITDGVVVAGPCPVSSYFDDKFEVMQDGHNNHKGEFLLCYEKQLQYIEPFLQGPKVIVDVGCGPGIRYHRGTQCRVIGLEPSFHSIRVNNDVDVRLCGSAKEMPFANHSVDAIICLYSIHHMVGWSRMETHDNVRKAFQEFARVLKPEGDLFVAEMNPTSLSWLAQRVFWNSARRILQGKLDQLFWSGSELKLLAEQVLPKTNLTQIVPEVSPWMMIPPIFSLPWLKVPRIFFPLRSSLFHWALRSDSPVSFAAA